MYKQSPLQKFHSLNLSPSQINSFLWSKNDWYDSYILGNFKESPEMTFGTAVDLRIQDDPTFLPNLPRYEKMQDKIVCMLGDIPLVGKPDGYNITKDKRLFDYKTGRVAWTQKKVNESVQLKFYLLLLYMKYKIKPEDFICGIHWMETQRHEDGDFKTTISFVKEGDIQTFETKYTLTDILKFASFIKSIYAEMEKYIESRG